MSSITTPRAENSATRLEFWRDIVSRNFVPLEIVPRERPDFHAQLRIARVGEVRVSVVATPPHTARTRRPAGSDASDHVKVSLQLTGHCVLTQGDHQAELKPGELAVYDTRRPYTLDTDYHHQVGTCRMGTGPEAVVDPLLRVHGVPGLRVADASVMPAVPSGNTHAPTVMIGERCAEFLLG